MKSLIITGRRWFESTNGNTYHSVTIEIDGQETLREPFRYGYGDQYMQTAQELLVTAGKIPHQDMKSAGASWKPFCQQLRELKEAGTVVYTQVIDVCRKKDL